MKLIHGFSREFVWSTALGPVATLAGELRGVAAADMTGSQRLPMETAAELAEAALTGLLSVTAYAKAAREMQGRAAAAKDSMEELRAAFRLMRVAWSFETDSTTKTVGA